jgi:hypothetical protein
MKLYISGVFKYKKAEFLPFISNKINTVMTFLNLRSETNVFLNLYLQFD